MVTTGIAIVAGEITTKAVIDYADVVRQVIRDVGYTDDKMGICADTCAVMLSIDRQSPDIAMGVNEDAAKGKEIGAGDQGLMFGYACNDTPELMPLPIALAHQILNRLTGPAQEGEVAWLRPDSKSQVTVEYDDSKPVRIDTVVVSTQHTPEVSQAEIRKFVIEKVVKPLLPKALVNGEITYHINPTGRFEVGGPHGDCGLTGRKIIVDTYGGWARHGGGAFSGKDPTKVDRSAAYMARHVAKNIVAAGLADRCEVQLAYAIGVSEPVSVLVDTRRHRARSTTSGSARLVRKVFPLDAQRDHQVSRPAPADLSQDGLGRAFRPQRSRIHLGKDPSCRGVGRGRGALNRWKRMTAEIRCGHPEGSEGSCRECRGDSSLRSE